MVRRSGVGGRKSEGERNQGVRLKAVSRDFEFLIVQEIIQLCFFHSILK